MIEHPVGNYTNIKKRERNVVFDLLTMILIYYMVRYVHDGRDGGLGHIPNFFCGGLCMLRENETAESHACIRCGYGI